MSTRVYWFEYNLNRFFFFFPLRLPLNFPSIHVLAHPTLVRAFLEVLD